MPSLTDQKLAEVKLNCYRGIARVQLGSLQFHQRLIRETHREVSRPNVLRLERIFERNGCLRLQDDHVINAIIQDEDLTKALAIKGIEEDEFRALQWAQDAPLLDLKEVQCLSGLHRVEAAHRFLPDNDKWWIVRLFTSGMMARQHNAHKTNRLIRNPKANLDTYH